MKTILLALLLSVGVYAQDKGKKEGGGSGNGGGQEQGPGAGSGAGAKKSICNWSVEVGEVDPATSHWGRSISPVIGGEKKNLTNIDACFAAAVKSLKAACKKNKPNPIKGTLNYLAKGEAATQAKVIAGTCAEPKFE